MITTVFGWFVAVLMLCVCNTLFNFLSFPRSGTFHTFPSGGVSFSEGKGVGESPSLRDYKSSVLCFFFAWRGKKVEGLWVWLSCSTLEHTNWY